MTVAPKMPMSPIYSSSGFPHSAMPKSNTIFHPTVSDELHGATRDRTVEGVASRQPRDEASLDPAKHDDSMGMCRPGGHYTRTSAYSKVFSGTSIGYERIPAESNSVTGLSRALLTFKPSKRCDLCLKFLNMKFLCYVVEIIKCNNDIDLNVLTPIFIVFILMDWSVE